jgi:trk system potassium uptake protein TrkH
MNLRRVLRILGLVLYALAGAQLVPLVWCFLPVDGVSIRGFLAGSGLSALLGLTFQLVGHNEGELYRREGVLTVVGAWLLASLAGAVPYVASGAIASPVDAFFESVSGFTTTGASILLEIEALPRPILFWRSLTQWLGGIGIVVLFVALLSELGPGARFLVKLEMPGPKAEIMHARVRHTALALFRIYLALSAAQVLLMLLLGASVYDALVYTFSTMSTGGFAPYSESASHFPVANQLVILVFMIVAGGNFSLYYALAARRNWGVLRDAELRTYLGMIAAASVLVASDVLAYDAAADVGRTAVDAVFQVTSILTTTGFATADFADWPDVSRAVLVAVMVGGGCAGSTAGGTKVIRLLIGWKAAMREVRLTYRPNAVVAITQGGRAVPEDNVRGVVGLLLLWVLAWGVGGLLLSVGGAGIVTATTAAIATLSNVGPGLEAVGPAGNFAAFAPWQKLVMTVLMLLGRLEFFAMLALFQSRFWRR